MPFIISVYFAKQFCGNYSMFCNTTSQLNDLAYEAYNISTFYPHTTASCFLWEHEPHQSYYLTGPILQRYWNVFEQQSNYNHFKNDWAEMLWQGHLFIPTAIGFVFSVEISVVSHLLVSELPAIIYLKAAIQNQVSVTNWIELLPRSICHSVLSQLYHWCSIVNNRFVNKSE